MKTISIFFVYLAFFCSLFAGANVLVSLGYSHSFFGKYISNPTVYFFVFAFVLSSLNNCMKYKIEVRTFLCLLMAAVCSMFVNGADFPRNTLFPSLMLPALVSIILSKLGKNLNKEVFKKIFYVYFFVECIVAIIERILGFCFFPDLGFETGFNEMGFEGFRSFSLRGHPLANGAVVSLMISFILVSKASLVNKNCMTLLGIIALLCFNARFAIVITCGFYAIYIYKVLRKSKVQTKIFYLLVIFIFLAVLSKLFSQGWGDRLVQNGLDDDSSGARLVALKLITDRSISDLLVGYNSLEIERMFDSLAGIGAAIENCWIILLLQYGIIFFILGVCCYIPMFRKQLRDYPRFKACFITIPWLLIQSSSNSLAGGGVTICMLFIMYFAFSDDFKN